MNDAAFEEFLATINKLRESITAPPVPPATAHTEPAPRSNDELARDLTKLRPADANKIVIDALAATMQARQDTRPSSPWHRAMSEWQPGHSPWFQSRTWEPHTD